MDLQDFMKGLENTYPEQETAKLAGSFTIFINRDNTFGKVCLSVHLFVFTSSRRRISQFWGNGVLLLSLYINPKSNKF